jgi:protein gp37
MALRLQNMPNGTGAKYRGTARRSPSGRPMFTGHINFDEKALETPRHWKLPRIIFVNSMSDLFHEAVSDEQIHRVFGVMIECKQHTFQVLTKRPQRLREMAHEFDWTPNIWVGTSVESMDYYDRIRELAKVRQARVRFLSCEPLLGPLKRMPLKDINWCIVGGESGPGARPMESEWVLSIRDQCLEKDVDFFFKQWGGVRKHETGRELDGDEWNSMPETRDVQRVA